MEKLATIKGDVLSTGTYPDYGAQSAPLFTSLQNVLSRRGLLEPFPSGVDLFFTGVDVPITGLLQTRSEGVKKVVFGTLEDLYFWDALTNVVTLEGSGYAGVLDSSPSQNATLWSLQPWGDWVLATNGVDAPQIYKPGDGFGDIAEAESQWGTAEIFLVWQQYVYAFNLEDHPSGVARSDFNEPEVWIPTPENRADVQFIRALGGGDIRAAGVMQGLPVAFGEDSLHVMEPLSGGRFGNRELVKGIGAYGKNAVTFVKGRAYGWGPKGPWVCDGVSYEYLQIPAVERELFKLLNVEAASKIVAYHDPAMRGIVFGFPAEGLPYNSMAMVYCYDDHSWNPMLLGRTVADDGAIFDWPITASRSGRVYRQGQEDIPFSEDEGVPLTLDTLALYSSGWGELGYGELGWGGELDAEG